MSKSTETLLQVEDLRTSFRTDEGVVQALEGVSFTVERGRVLGIVGESGSGKSVTALSIMGLLPASATTTGKVSLGGQLLLEADQRSMQKIRGRDMAMVFQDPMTSLNPFHTVGWQLREAVTLHLDCSRAEADARVIELLGEVDIPDPELRMKSYPHQLSGGMRQRVMIAMAAVHRPSLLIADEPTTALDVTTQMQILALLRRLRDEAGSAVVIITHDLGVVAELCDDVVVMYGGRVVEQGAINRIFERPYHPYTWGLLASLPSRATDGRLVVIPGSPPSLLRRSSGCPFHPRCQFSMDVCEAEMPPLVAVPGDPRHLAACHLPAETRETTVAGVNPGGVS